MSSSSRAPDKTSKPGTRPLLAATEPIPLSVRKVPPGGVRSAMRRTSTGTAMRRHTGEISVVGRDGTSIRIPTYAVVGLPLLMVFLVLTIPGLEIPVLDDLRRQRPFKIGSGLLLALALVLQFHLPMRRASETLSARALRLHRWAGALLPLSLILHGARLGAGYLTVLTGALVLAIFTGHINPRAMHLRRRAFSRLYAKAWLLTHVALSVAVPALVLFHVWVVFSLKAT